MVSSGDTVVPEAARPLALQKANECTTMIALQPEPGLQGDSRGDRKG